jgi:transposase-like protein
LRRSGCCAGGILQELIEAEATEAIGAAPGEHSDRRATWRNGTVTGC